MKWYVTLIVVALVLVTAYMLSPNFDKLVLRVQTRRTKRLKLKLYVEYTQSVQECKVETDRLNAELLAWAEFNDDDPISEIIISEMLAPKADTPNAAQDWASLPKPPTAKGRSHLAKVLIESVHSLDSAAQAAMRQKGSIIISQLIDSASIAELHNFMSLNDSSRTLRSTIEAVYQWVSESRL